MENQKVDKETLGKLVQKVFDQYVYKFSVLRLGELVFLPGEEEKDEPCITYDETDNNFCVEYFSTEFLKLRPVIGPTVPSGYHDLLDYLRYFNDDEVVHSLNIYPKTLHSYKEYILYIDKVGNLGILEGKVEV